MIDKKILITGGSGLLGRELEKILPNAYYPSHSEFDIISYDKMKKYILNKKIDTILHAAAITKLEDIRKDATSALETNIIGTSNLVKLCMENNIRIVYVSTDYVFSGEKGNYSENDELLPVNKYAWSKLGGECAVKLYDNSLIVRTSFGPYPFPYEGAFVDQWTSRDDVRNVAKKIKQLIESNINGIIHIGSGRKTVYEYAQTISPDKDIKKISIKDMKLVLPKDTSLNTSKYDDIFNK